LGLIEKDGYVYYLHNGSPIYCHASEDRNSYRFIVGNLICNKLCTISEFHESLGEARKNIERYARTFREKGAEYFFSRKETRGQCYKMTEALKSEIRLKLDEGMSQFSHLSSIVKPTVPHYSKKYGTNIISLYLLIASM